MKLNDKVTLITGAAGGIGLACAQRFSAEGSRVLFLASDDSSYVIGQVIYIDGGRLGLNYTVPVPE